MSRPSRPAGERPQGNTRPAPNCEPEAASGSPRAAECALQPLSATGKGESAPLGHGAAEAAERAAFCGAFRTHLRLERQLGARSVAAYVADVSSYLRARTQMPFAQVFSEAPLVAYVSQRVASGAALKSVARAVAALRAALHVARTWPGLGPVLAPEALKAPKVGRSLPKAPTTGQLTEFFTALGASGLEGQRDAALFALLYAAGLRVSEAVGLPLEAYDAAGGALRVRGKGGRERLIPLDPDAQALVERYLADVRPLWAPPQCRELFVSRRKKPLTRQAVWKRMQTLARDAGLGDAMHPHQLRHAFATQALRAGADLRTLQVLLGHASIDTTQIYTQVSNERLASVHAQAHPRGRRS